MLKKALILVDLQNDFMPDGTLPVPGSDEIIPLLNKLQDYFIDVIATQDWHPRNHGGFAANHLDRSPGECIELAGLPQILWPIHCVQGTKGAEFVELLEQDSWSQIVRKGTDPNIDSYSGFFDNARRKATGLGDYLKAKAIAEVYIAGVATDYCVKYTGLDARSLGFKTFLIEDACRGVDLNPKDSLKAIQEMQSVGICVLRAADIFRQFKPALKGKR